MPITHTTVATLPDEPGAEINAAEWNAAHTNPEIDDVIGLQDALDAKASAPASSTDNALARYNGSDGAFQDSAAFLNDDGQLSLGTDTPNAALLLDMVSTDQGLGLPAMSSAQINAINSPPSRTMVFDNELFVPKFRGEFDWFQMTPGVTKPTFFDASYTDFFQPVFYGFKKLRLKSQNVIGTEGDLFMPNRAGTLALLDDIPGAPVFTVVEKNLGTTPRKSGRFTITGLSGLTVGKPVNISQAVGPYTGKGTRADEAEMDGLIVKAMVTAADTITAYWNAATRVKGNVKFNYLIGA